MDVIANICLHPSEICEYNSTRYIKVKDKKLATIYWLLLVLVLFYVVGYTIIGDKGYQAHAPAIGTSSVKIKGSASIGDMDKYEKVTDLVVLDSMDVVVPAIEQDAFFITTARTITKNQTRSFCDGNHRTEKCTKDDKSACQKSLFNWASQGLYTGKCGDNDRCQMYTWCPLENRSDVEMINNIGAMTVFVKIDINFEEFDVHRENQYDIKKNKRPVFGYNLWTVDDILSNATHGNVTSYKQIADRGAIILFSSVWNCNLDRGGEKHCNPKYSMRRIDNTPNTISSGFNFRNVIYDPSQTARVLKKLYGIRVVFIVEGSAGKFSWVELTETLGAGLAYLGMAAMFTDVILENFLPESKVYLGHKEKEIKHSVEMHSGSQSAKTARTSMPTPSDRQSDTLKTC